jgi:hypothetical protein
MIVVIGSSVGGIVIVMYLPMFMIFELIKERPHPRYSGLFSVE